MGIGNVGSVAGFRQVGAFEIYSLIVRTTLEVGRVSAIPPNGRERAHVAPMTRLRRHRQVSSWRESCMIFAVARRYHADTDHPARHDLPLPAAGRLWRAPDDAPPTRLPRSKSDRGEPGDQPGAQKP